MVFDVKSLNSEEIIATRLLLEKLDCTHKNLACVVCSCFEICRFLNKLSAQCVDVLEERIFHDNH